MSRRGGINVNSRIHTDMEMGDTGVNGRCNGQVPVKRVRVLIRKHLSSVGWVWCECAGIYPLQKNKNKNKKKTFKEENLMKKKH